MKTAYNTSTLTRSLVIDLDVYTDGDVEMRKELITLMIDNIHELAESLELSYQKNDIEIFRKISHKVKPTISMLNDKDLTTAIEEIKSSQENQPERLSSFKMLCQEIAEILARENG